MGHCQAASKPFGPGPFHSQDLPERAGPALSFPGKPQSNSQLPQDPTCPDIPTPHSSFIFPFTQNCLSPSLSSGLIQCCSWISLPLAGVGPGCTDETLLSAIASALHTSTMPITGQLSAAVEKNPGVWLNTSQPLCKAFMVTDEDIRKQEELVQQVRKRLEEALMADMLAHVEEIARDGEPPSEKEGAEEEGEEEEEEEEQDHDQEMENV
uniref:Methyl-CpG binding protein 2/3 C-terminal domain-containing protein n=1 Tax=Junco hyemalis TaxID=40217 RepID=A0A8C5JBG4_JUNHY